MTRDASELPIYRRPSRRKLMKTLRKLKAILPAVTSGASDDGCEDIADFLERLVDHCQVVTGCAVSPAVARAETAEAAELSESPSFELPDAEDADSPPAESAAAPELSVSCLSAAAVHDLAEHLCALGPVRLA